MNAELVGRLKSAREQLQPVTLYQSFGRLTKVNGMTLTVDGGRFHMGQRCQVEGQQGQWLEAEVVGFDKQSAYLMPLTTANQLHAGARVKAQSQPQQLQIGPSLLGRVVDGLLRPLDERPLSPGKHKVDADTILLNPMQRQSVSEPLDVGIRALNALFTVGKGQRMGLFAGSGVGKSKLLGMMTRFTSADVVIVGLIGERGWEVRDFIQHSLGEAGLQKAVVVAAPADQSPLLRLRAAELSHRLAAYFRDQGKNVLLLMDSLTRYAQAQREIALSVGEPPATKGYPPSVFSKLTRLVESSGNSNASQGSMTALYTVLAEGDDQQDPIVDSTRAILDGHIVLNRELAEAGHYPAIDIGASISRVMPSIVDEAHLQACYRLKRLYSRYRQVQELIPLGAYQAGQDAELDKAVRLYPAIEAFLCQALSERATLADSLTGLMELLNEDA
ncbi:FliI/YscN family ATPase [Bowmanella pacifica]|uniref:Flagellum-specific ATP synthase n=1 Tax=Bowmanella pacifica TaxID=502051 RepID=A0A917YYR7_9ALTE|nr:FliI/YscN family ATPase [Bowmanella pacifica]GGO69407.1 flagellum-specific ATP synthase [Bowmanella pacifica]